MQETRLGLVEARFADIVWANAPLTTRRLVELCDEQLDWRRTTTYTVLRKFCERGVFQAQNGIVSVLIPKEEFFAMRSEQIVSESYGGSLPAFIAAFTSRKTLTEKETEEIKKLLDNISR